MEDVHVADRQDVQSTQNTAVQQTEQKPRTAPSRGISKMSDGYREVLPSDPNKFKMFEKYLTPPERTGFEQFCKGVERITESWFKTKGSQIRAKEDFDHIAAKLVMNFHKCWVNESIDATDKKAFVSLLEDLKLEARILGMNPEQFCGRLEDCFTVAAKSFVDSDFFLSAHVYMNTTSPAWAATPLAAPPIPMPTTSASVSATSSNLSLQSA